MKDEKKLLKILQDEKIYQITLYLFAVDLKEFKLKIDKDKSFCKIIAILLDRPDDELSQKMIDIKQAILARDIDSLTTKAFTAFQKKMQCPVCHWSSRLVVTKDSHLCVNCGYRFPF